MLTQSLKDLESGVLEQFRLVRGPETGGPSPKFDAENLQRVTELGHQRLEQAKQKYEKKLGKLERITNGFWNESTYQLITAINGVVMFTLWGIALGYSISNYIDEADHKQTKSLVFKLMALGTNISFCYFFNKLGEINRLRYSVSEKIVERIHKLDNLYQFAHHQYQLSRSLSEDSLDAKADRIHHCVSAFEKLPLKQRQRLEITDANQLGALLIVGLGTEDQLYKEFQDLAAVKRSQGLLANSSGNLHTSIETPQQPQSHGSSAVIGTARLPGIRLARAPTPPDSSFRQYRTSPFLAHLEAGAGRQRTFDESESIEEDREGVERLQRPSQEAVEQREDERLLRIQKMENNLRERLKLEPAKVLEKLCDPVYE